MNYNRTFTHTQVGFITTLVEPIHVETSLEYVKKIFKENEVYTAIPIEGDMGVVGMIERDEVMKEHGMIDNLLHNKLSYYLDKKAVIIDAREHVERALEQLVTPDHMINNCMIFHLGRYYGIIHTLTLLTHIFKLRTDTLNRARTIQTYFTGENDFSHDSFKAHVSVQQARALGGDFYQMSKLNDTESLVSCFDVSGKDIQASLMTGLICGYFASLEQIAQKGRVDSMEVVHDLHEIIRQKTPDDIFVAGIMIFYDSVEGAISLYNMGYSPVYIIRKEENKRKIRLRNPSLPPLGFPSLMCDEKSVIKLKAEPNLVIFGFSDGLTDAHDKHGTEYGDERVTKMVQQSLTEGSSEIAKRLLADVNEFVGNSPRTDDITVFQVSIEV